MQDDEAVAGAGLVHRGGRAGLHLQVDQLDAQGQQVIGAHGGLARATGLEQAADGRGLQQARWHEHIGHANFGGPLTAPQLKPAPQGGFILHYDPAIAVPVKAATPEMAAVGEAFLWRAYGAIQCDTLLLRGTESDLLSAQTAQTMTEVGPKARLVEFAGVGHAPTLVQPDQVRTVMDFLDA